MLGEETGRAQTHGLEESSRAGTESILRAIGKRAREQGGFTLIEVLVVVVLLGVVLIPIMNGLVFEGNQTPIDTAYARAIGAQTASLQRMMEEVRQAYAIVDTNGDPSSGVGSYIDFLVLIYNAGTGTDNSWEVKYDCSRASQTVTGQLACVRFACQASAYDKTCSLPTTYPSSASGSSSGVVIDNVLNTSGNVFTFRDRNGNPATNAQDIWTVEANVQVPANGSAKFATRHPGPSHAMTLDNQTDLPNLQNGT
jgi:prepilin-type N-terminal cleavage/methylation domain-containing protein